MTKREYELWIASLIESRNDDISDIGVKASESNYVLEGYIKIDSQSLEDVNAGLVKMFGEDYETFETQADLDRNIRDGWFSLHGDYLAAWYDGLL